MKKVQKQNSKNFIRAVVYGTIANYESGEWRFCKQMDVPSNVRSGMFLEIKVPPKTGHFGGRFLEFEVRRVIWSEKTRQLEIEVAF